jgi:hypothetical protein
MANIRYILCVAISNDVTCNMYHYDVEGHHPTLSIEETGRSAFYWLVPIQPKFGVRRLL